MEAAIRFSVAIALVLVLSAAGLTYEIAAGRVLAPFFGASLLTWTTVIATVLGGFSLGSALGGIVAERPRAVALRNVRSALVATAVLMAVSPALLGVLYAWGARGTHGMMISVFLVFFPASVFVTLPSPLLAKLAIEARPGREGSSLGFVLAAGSIGAIFGAILAGFVTLPLIGSTATFVACGAVALLCLPFVRSGGQANPGVTVAAAGFVAFAALAGSPVCQYESGLSCLHVAQRGPEVRLVSDGTVQAAERVTPVEADESTVELVLSYTEWMWARMDRDLGPEASVLFVGGGGYTLPTKLLASRQEAQAVAVEIDPLVTEVVRVHMPSAAEMIAQAGYHVSEDKVSEGRLGIVHADGRVFLNETDQRFDAAVMDAFSSGSVPAHLVTRETFARLREIVDGPVYVNLLDAPDGPLARGVHAILRALYPHVQVVQGQVNARGRTNILFAASRQPLDPLDSSPDGYGPTQISDARAFTDDRGWIGHR
ncbi:fused MFS/spermidine synthase [Lutimaribacter sp. EGI FJ00015]|uniref:Fused MFS/spermidine synthase n=1 Tax=Lutimaribacter degradans TaxID=2945989 RepID=A0ACC5ZZV9_9RHOB|nr:fused MFS/spermidine synthase [Lutimaribacter sp. EGI FJ00013]MCM2563640.1 fused MFS/spermidine synthase [Lutimaribacter sp. EGI FJ00013]MCO0614824.1 fused MFS/spermidine synthase [Lutimaribacter sp. EGI FJ00015]MCO0637492.1 fused MFS/spermidine synthase [Lutimaribacter sp. EGI FJ00014]